MLRCIHPTCMSFTHLSTVHLHTLCSHSVTPPPTVCNCMLLPCLAGEASAPADALWLMSRVRGYRPALEYCGGTELAGEGHQRIVLMLLHPRRRVLHFR